MKRLSEMTMEIYVLKVNTNDKNRVMLYSYEHHSYIGFEKCKMCSFPLCSCLRY